MRVVASNDDPDAFERQAKKAPDRARSDAEMWGRRVESGPSVIGAIRLVVRISDGPAR